MTARCSRSSPPRPWSAVPSRRRPALPKERVEELRTAFMAMVKDPDFLAEVAKLNFDLDPLSGADLQDFFVKAEYAPALIDKAKAVAKLAEH